ncbi:MAG: hypothetical protein R2724_33985 [Bryobacterales bacterium]
MKIVFDGEEPGLAEHRLSLSSFAQPLGNLLKALQRTASAILASALEDPEYGARGGNYAAEAKLLDLELVSVEGGCVSPTFVCTSRPGAQLVLGLEDLSKRAIQKLLRDIDSERQGRLASVAARKYLASLPKGVRSQRYTATADGELVAEVQFVEANLLDVTVGPARLIRLRGSIVSLGFEPGMTYVSIKSDSHGTVKCTATSEQVEHAVSLRNQSIVAAVHENQKCVLIWLRDAAKDVPRVPVDATIDHLRDRWSETLRVLAQ